MLAIFRLFICKNWSKHLKQTFFEIIFVILINIRSIIWPNRFIFKASVKNIDHYELFSEITTKMCGFFFVENLREKYIQIGYNKTINRLITLKKNYVKIHSRQSTKSYLFTNSLKIYSTSHCGLSHQPHELVECRREI